MSKLDHDTREIGLSVEAIVKTDEDLATISTLNEFAQRTGNILVLTGGYATEALCGEKITRAHGDVDVHFILVGSESSDKLLSELQVLLFKEDTKWVVRERNPKRVDYVEDVENKDFFDKRRIEVHLIPSNEATMKYSKKKIIDSKGRDIEVNVIDLTQTITEKIRKFYELRSGVDTNKDRHSSESDYIDLKRLLALNEFDRGNVSTEEYDYVISLISSH